jgi:hypothetical protein
MDCLRSGQLERENRARPAARRGGFVGFGVEESGKAGARVEGAA